MSDLRSAAEEKVLHDGRKLLFPISRRAHFDRPEFRSQAAARKAVPRQAPAEALRGRASGSRNPRSQNRDLQSAAGSLQKVRAALLKELENRNLASDDRIAIGHRCDAALKESYALHLLLDLMERHDREARINPCPPPLLSS
jgi:hypothetical protein